MAAWRRAAPAYVLADFHLLDTGREDLQAFTRTTADGQRYLVGLNFSSESRTLALDVARGGAWRVAYTTCDGLEVGGAVGASLKLAPWQAVILHRR